MIVPRVGFPAKTDSLLIVDDWQDWNLIITVGSSRQDEFGIFVTNKQIGSTQLPKVRQGKFRTIPGEIT